MQKQIKIKGLQSLIVGQIHDSIILDIVPEEEEEIVAMLKDIMTQRIIKYWKWIIVSLDIEIDVTPIDGSWNEKQRRK